jgi:hypothetical protein
MSIDDVVKYVATCDDRHLWQITGALLARMVKKWGKKTALELLDALVNNGEAA